MFTSADCLRDWFSSGTKFLGQFVTVGIKYVAKANRQQMAIIVKSFIWCRFVFVRICYIKAFYANFHIFVRKISLKSFEYYSKVLCKYVHIYSLLLLSLTNSNVTFLVIKIVDTSSVAVYVKIWSYIFQMVPRI